MAVRSLLLLAAVLIMPNALYAHGSVESELYFFPAETYVEVQVILPLSELSLVFKETLDRESLLKPRAKEYLLSHIVAESPGEKRWKIEVQKLSIEADLRRHEGFENHHHDGEPYNLVGLMRLTPPADDDSSVINLKYTAINQEVVSHRTRVFMSPDGDKATTPTELQVIYSFQPKLTLHLARPINNFGKRGDSETSGTESAGYSSSDIHTTAANL